MIESDDIIYAQVLRNLRHFSGRKQLDIAQALGLTNQRAMSDYEQGEKHFTKEFIQKTCALFGITEVEFEKLAKKLKNYKTSSTGVSISKVEKTNPGLIDYKIKLLLYRKENVELQLEKVRLERLLCEAQSKLKSLRFNDATQNIYVAI